MLHALLEAFLTKMEDVLSVKLQTSQTVLLLHRLRTVICAYALSVPMVRLVIYVILQILASDTCPNDGWKLLPGANDGRLFRCGDVIEYAVFDTLSVSWVGGQVGGWYGHCVPAGVMNNGKMNCGDNSEEGTEEPVTCQWPLIRKADGMCKECEDG